MTISDKRIRARRALDRPDAETWRPLVGAASSAVCDGQGRTGALDIGIRPLTSKAVFTGPALTLECRAGDNVTALAALDWIRPGDVVVIANGGATHAAVIGGHYAAMAWARGAVAVVSDGPARDLDELEDIGVPIFARGVTPAGPFKSGPGTIGFPVVIGAVTIASGDVLVGDRDGVVVVRRDDIAAAVAGHETVKAREAVLAQAARSDQMPDWIREAVDRVGIDLE